MSILIKGVKITDCWNCPCIDGEYGECNILGKTIKSERGRLDDCPLIELPDHGDLIDKDALKEDIADKYDCETWVGIDEAIKCADAAHVVIPAERSEDEKAQ